MRKPTIKSAFIAAAMAVSLLGSGVVLADAGRYRDDRHDSGHLRDYGHQKQYKQRHHKQYRYGGNHDRGYYHRGHHGSHVTNYYEYDDNDSDELLIGLAIGGLLGYAINHAGYE
jgi:hypothetical protein